MSSKSEVASLIAEADGSASYEEGDASLIKSTVEEVSTVLEVTQDSMRAICRDVEAASSKGELKKAFVRLNGVWSILLGVQLQSGSEPLLIEAISALEVSARLASFLATATSAASALKSYKGAIMSQLAKVIREKEEKKRIVDEMDEALFSRFLPEPSPTCDEGDSEAIKTVLQGQDSLIRTGPAKRSFSQVEQSQSVHLMRSKVPALASVAQVTAESDLQNTPKKKVLMTREKLRSGLHDPRGLLDLSGSSTNALERMKRLELLKSAGVGFDTKKNSSFSEKLNAAIARLDLGLGGQSLSDSLLFGAKVLSAPRSLSQKNISDIEYNVVDGKTTWSHQNLYAKMMIAGCLDQSKRIIEKFDEVLFGPAPEAVVEKTHRDIRSLLCSEKCREFMSNKDSTDDAAAKASDNFIKGIVEAIGPVVPISMRNKSLDGGYLRTALYLLGAAEFLFSQYETDVRVKANPSGLVGLCSAMHAEIERSVLWQKELRDFNEFMKDMKSQYQTSLGLGGGFANDAARRPKKRSRNPRGRYGFRHQPVQGRGNSYPTQQNAPFVSNSLRGRGRGTPVGSSRNLIDIAELRARGICFDYRAGNCGRGDSCRFLHSN